MDRETDLSNDPENLTAVEREKPLLAASFFAVQGNKVLTVIREGGVYEGFIAMPHGFTEYLEEEGRMETPNEAALRELTEETGGLEGRMISLINERDTVMPDGVGGIRSGKNIRISVFSGEITGGEIDPSNPHRPEWREMPGLTIRDDVVPDLVDAIKRYLGKATDSESSSE